MIDFNKDIDKSDQEPHSCGIFGDAFCDFVSTSYAGLENKNLKKVTEVKKKHQCCTENYHN